jgi:hypothetical protein
VPNVSRFLVSQIDSFTTSVDLTTAALNVEKHEQQRDHRRCWHAPLAVTIIILLSA